MTKTQKLRNLAEGLMAGLVECGFEGPWRWAHHQWEGSFYRVWSDWEPHNDAAFPRFQLGGSSDGRASQAREILWQLKRTSPFHDFQTGKLPSKPSGLSPREFLGIRCEGATPDEWVALAAAFLDEMARWHTVDLSGPRSSE